MISQNDLQLGDFVRYSIYPFGHDILGQIENTPEGCDTENPYIIRTHPTEMQTKKLEGLSDMCYLENAEFIRIIDEIDFLSSGGCACHRCQPSEVLEFDYCYVIAYHIDEDGNYHDDEGNFRDGQTHEVIE